jgi:hypothetical protein
VALKCVVDNIATFAVEIKLVQQLEGFLSPSNIIDMRPELIEKIAVESPSVVTQREQLSRKLEVLVSGMNVCRRGTRGEKMSFLPFLRKGNSSLTEEC